MEAELGCRGCSICYIILVLFSTLMWFVSLCCFDRFQSLPKKLQSSGRERREVEKGEEEGERERTECFTELSWTLPSPR